MNTQIKKRVLVVGASGFVGSAATAALAREPNCQVVACSRRKPQPCPANVTFISLDLLDAQACRVVVQELADVTHVVYAAINETPGDLVASWMDPDHAGRNARMLENLMEPLLAVATNFQQAVIIHGTKAYGVTLDRHLPVPLKESMPRPVHENFYFNQEDYIWAKSKTAGWCWTVFRAQMIAGGGLGSNLNCLMAISVYAELCKDAGEVCYFPGSPDAKGVIEMIDVELFADAIVWSTKAESARNQIFNITNGDVFSWPDLWPVICEEIGVTPGEARPTSLVKAVGDQKERWASLVQQHRLASPAEWYEFLGESCALADFSVNASRNVLASTIKLRQAGFGDCMDSHECVKKWIRCWRNEKLLPPR